jgi:hypothetical protein
MERDGGPTGDVRRVQLPSGKTIDVVSPREGKNALRPDLHVCLDCRSELVYPVVWEEAGSAGWRVLLRCPNCEVRREGVFRQDSLDAFDKELDRGRDAVLFDYRQLLWSNMADEIGRFVAALEADAVLPEDF